MRRIHKMLIAAGLLAIAFALLPWIATAIPEAAGLTAVSVPTGSMEPAVPAGSMAYVADGDASEGDVAAFYALDGRTLVLHRVLEIDDGSGTMLTKGDANPAPDVSRVPCGNTVGVLRASVPYLGSLAETMRTPAGRVCRAMLGYAGAMCLVMAACCRRRRY